MSSKALVPLNALASTTAPTLPTLRAGDLYFNTTSNTLFSYTGSAWVSASGGGVSSITAGTGLSGGVITTSGTIAIDSTVATLTGTQTLTNKTLTSPTLTAPALGTPASGVLTNATGLPLTTGVTGTLPVANGGTGVTTSTGSGANVLGTSPTLTTPNIGVATGTSFNSITGLSSTTPIVDGTAAVGTGTTTARGDHVHPTDTSRVAVSGASMTGLLVGSPTTAGVTILNSNDNGNFSVRGIASSATSPASMSFHRPNIYAINMGLDTDNNFKIGGWSAGAIMLTVTPAGNVTAPGQITAGANPPTAGKVSSVAASGGVSLALSDNVNNSLYVRHASGGGAVIGTDPGGSIRIATNGNAASDTKLTMDSTGAITLTGSINASSSLLWECATAGAITSRIKTGVYENSAPTVAGGWPETTSWYHLISATHSNTGNYYAAQYASDFFNSENLWYRSTNGGGSTVWNRVLQSTIQRAEKTASYTLVAQDVGRLIEMGVASANTLTVPLNSSVAFPVGAQINILQTGAGQTTIAGAGGVTINGTGTKLRVQWSSATLIKRATDTWVLIGDIS